MTEAPKAPVDEKTAKEKVGSVWAELGPVLLFVVTYNILLQFPDGEGLLTKDNALYWATGLLIASTLVVVAKRLLNKQKVPPMLLISSVLIGTFGAIGIITQSKLVLYMKPTIMNLLYAGVIFGGLAVGRNVGKMLLNSVFDLPDFAWKTIAIRWGLFFLAMAAWNEFLWRNFSEMTWGNWKLGNIAISFAFALANTPYMLKHMTPVEDDAEASPNE